MTDSADSIDSSNSTAEEGVVSEPAVPAFGALDIVEAFTAMRHEWRGQTKETRELAEQIQSAVRALTALEEDRRSRDEENQNSDSRTARPLAMLIAETDHQLTRAIGAIEQAEHQRWQRAQADWEHLRRNFDQMNPVARWFARSLRARLEDPQSTADSGQGNPAAEGLRLLLSRLRRSMLDCRIERLEVLGRPFDGTTMQAIGTIESAEFAVGHVAEQLAPCYRWNGQVLRFADVRVAASKEKGKLES